MVSVALLTLYLFNSFSFFCCLIIIGIVIKHENMSLKTAVHFAYQIQGLTNKAHAAVKELLEPPDVRLVPLFTWCSMISTLKSYIDIYCILT